MPNISRRAEATPESPIRRLAPYADAAKARGTQVYHLNIGQPDVEAPKEFWDSIKGIKDPIVAYTNSAGNIGLRQAAVEHYKEKGIDITVDQIFVTTAGSEAIIFAMLACLNEGDEVIVPEPMYANYIGFAAIAGIKCVPITTKIEDNYALPSVAEFAKRITPKTKAILICNPNNPTGTVYGRGQLEGLRELALKHDLFIFADEVYHEFNYTGVPVPSVLNLQGLESNVVAIDSVSKKFSLCGARVGFFMCRNPEVFHSAVKFAQARLSPPAIEQVGVEAALRHTPRAYFESMKSEYMDRRDLLVRKLRQLNGVVVPEVNGAFYAMVRLPIDDCDRFCKWLLEEFSFEGKTVMLAPGTGFYETDGLGKDEVRIAYVYRCEELAKALDVLAQGLSVYPGRTCEQALPLHN
ncbi:MAG: pyridoxal phosphate-dependent aminotransferase [Chthonomonas sp.]|nr:pyridoxal phosphate-dependent aminotransferase [Chthonomonas sp.]